MCAILKSPWVHHRPIHLDHHDCHHCHLNSEPRGPQLLRNPDSSALSSGTAQLASGDVRRRPEISWDPNTMLFHSSARAKVSSSELDQRIPGWEKILVESYFINLRSAIPKRIGRWTPTKMVINHFSNFLGVYTGGCYGWFELLRCPSTQSICIGHQVRLPTATGYLSLLQKDYPECTSFQ